MAAPPADGGTETASGRRVGVCEEIRDLEKLIEGSCGGIDRWCTASGVWESEEAPKARGTLKRYGRV